MIGRNGMGKTTLCNAIMGLMPRAEGLDRLPGPGAARAAAVPDRGLGHRLRAAGPAALPVAVGRRAPAHARRRHARQGVDAGEGLRALPAARRAEADRRHAALGRRAADARDRAGAADESDPADHGRALRGPRADDRRDARREHQEPRRRRDGRAARRAEPRRCDRGRRAAARDGVGAHRGGDDVGRRSSRIPTRSGVSSASSRSRSTAEHRRPGRDSFSGAAERKGATWRRSYWSGRSIRRGTSTRTSRSGCASTASTSCSSTPASRASRARAPDVTREEVAAAAGADVGALAAAGDRGAAVETMARGAAEVVEAAPRRGPARRDRGARRLRRLVARDLRDAAASDRGAEADGLDRRLRRHEPVRRLRRRDDDVLRRRHRRRQPDLGADHVQRRRGARGHGEGDGAARWAPSSR